MRRLGLRAAIVLLIALSLAARTAGLRSSGGQHPDFDGTAAITALVASAGLEVRPNPVAPPRVLSAAVYFIRSGCGAPSIALPFGINVEARHLLARLAPQGYTFRYYYLDQTWARQARLALYMEWLKHAALGVFGRSPYRTVKIAVVIADPLSCEGPDPIDWRRLWLRSGAELTPAAVSETHRLGKPSP